MITFKKKNLERKFVFYIFPFPINPAFVYLEFSKNGKLINRIAVRNNCMRDNQSLLKFKQPNDLCSFLLNDDFENYTHLIENGIWPKDSKTFLAKIIHKGLFGPLYLSYNGLDYKIKGGCFKYSIDELGIKFAADFFFSSSGTIECPAELEPIAFYLVEHFVGGQRD